MLKEFMGLLKEFLYKFPLESLKVIMKVSLEQVLLNASIWGGAMPADISNVISVEIPEETSGWVHEEISEGTTGKKSLAERVFSVS